MVNLVWSLYGLVGYALAQQAGVVDEDDGRSLVEALGAWLQYSRLIIHGEFEADDLNLPEGDDPIAIGKLAGWAGAGDQAAQAAINDMEGRAGQLARALSESLIEQQPPCTALGLLDQP